MWLPPTSFKYHQHHVNKWREVFRYLFYTYTYIYIYICIFFLHCQQMLCTPLCCSQETDHCPIRHAWENESRCYLPTLASAQGVPTTKSALDLSLSQTTAYLGHLSILRSDRLLWRWPPCVGLSSFQGIRSACQSRMLTHSTISKISGTSWGIGRASIGPHLITFY